MLGGSLILLITVGSGFAESFIIREPAVQVYSREKMGKQRTTRVNRLITDHLPMTKHLFVSSSLVLHFE
jgi:hypothetical protein